MSIRSGLIILALIFSFPLFAQQQYELNNGWKCIRATSINKSGGEISNINFPLKGWMPTVVPGTVLTSLLFNKLIPDPFYGMNNEHIPDIYKVGRDYYTYWFVKDFNEKTTSDEKIWLQFRGVNNSCDIFLNGHKVNTLTYKSMYLRQEYDITPYLNKDGHNRLAVIVYPPDPVGNPNGGQGGDGTIARNITNQYVAGWDWIQPVRDRNTGIWDKVFVKKTKLVKINNTHVITLVPGKRPPEETQASATIKISTELNNTTNRSLEGTLEWEFADRKGSIALTLNPGTQQITIPDITLKNPKLWWPNGYGKQNLYDLKITFTHNKIASDEDHIRFGVRELNALWNTHTQSRELRVNGQKIFVKGGNRILSDEMLRFSKERYDAEVRYHRDMNLNLIRVWGGGITERPEFYDACDKYGLLVLQDFWVSGDCNGRWYDPLKPEDTTTRRNYPDDHQLLVTSLADQIKMLRNHPSLAIWCGGNEIRPPADVLKPLRDSLLPQLDGTRFFFEYSNDDSMSYDAHDGPYTIQTDNYFWEHRSWGFNSEVGSVGIGDYESLERFIPKENMVIPQYDVAGKKWKIDSVWQYHKYVGYDSAIEAYGHPKDVKDFAMKAQLVNYNQYRALIEGYSSHMWDWYTGVIIWKTQNPWTAMLGQMYDVYLDPNACMYGLREGAKPLHVLFEPYVNKAVTIVNNSLEAKPAMKMKVEGYNMQGNKKINDSLIISLDSESKIINRSAYYYTFNDELDSLCKEDGAFLCLSLTDTTSGLIIDKNLYWLPDEHRKYSGLQKMLPAKIVVTTQSLKNGSAALTITNPVHGAVAFFIRISLVDKKTKKRILPAFCNNNYISVLPGESETIQIEFTPQKDIEPMVCIEGWNVRKQYIELKN